MGLDFRWRTALEGEMPLISSSGEASAAAFVVAAISASALSSSASLAISVGLGMILSFTMVCSEWYV